MITVRPDPARPMGGFALLCLPANDLDGESAEVAVFDNYSERYLGDAGWQATKVVFGPYAVQRDGGEARIVIGPEIVNQIEAYANVKLLVGSVSQDVAWPDEVFPAPGAARIGEIRATAQTEQGQSTLSARKPDPEPVPEPEITAPPTILEPTAKGSKRRGGVLVLLLFLFLAAAGSYWYVLQRNTPHEPVAQDNCALPALSALDGFSSQLDALRDCGERATADAALRLTEEAAAAGNPQALLLFGTVYDAGSHAPVLEDTIGFTFDDAPATAAEYYARAVEAGATEAAERLSVLCARMADMDDTLALGAYADYCAG